MILIFDILIEQSLDLIAMLELRVDTMDCVRRGSMMSFRRPAHGILLAALALASCQYDTHVEPSEIVSNVLGPGGDLRAIEYRNDLGAFGFGQETVSVLPSDAPVGTAVDHTVCTDCRFLRWESARRLVVESNVLSKLRSGEHWSRTFHAKPGLTISVIPFPRAIPERLTEVRREPSPDSSLMAVAYRYDDSTRNAVLHVSVVAPGQGLPEYGNVMISDTDIDGINGLAWNTRDTLVLMCDQENRVRVVTMLVRNPPVSAVAVRAIGSVDMGYRLRIKR